MDFSLGAGRWLGRDGHFIRFFGIQSDPVSSDFFVFAQPVLAGGPHPASRAGLGGSFGVHRHVLLPYAELTCFGSQPVIDSMCYSCINFLFSTKYRFDYPILHIEAKMGGSGVFIL